MEQGYTSDESYVDPEPKEKIFCGGVLRKECPDKVEIQRDGRLCQNCRETLDKRSQEIKEKNINERRDARR